MHSSNYIKRITLALTFLLAFGVLTSIILPLDKVLADTRLAADENHQQPLVANVGSTIYLPVVTKNYPWISPFAIESNPSLAAGSPYLTKTVELNAGWARMNNRISWRELQPNPDDEINWSLLASFEEELGNLRAAGITPVVIIQDSPHWAVIPNVRQDSKPTSCGPIAGEYFDEFADFVRQLVERYKSPEFNVHDWEIGNEPDIDPNGVIVDSIFGCWGNFKDDLYGGEHYGEMLKYVTPFIKAADPSAKVWVGGLLLDSPNSSPTYGSRPELFFKGILESGAAPYFDIVPYHAYIGYNANFTGDYEREASLKWKVSGGIIVGKAGYLRQLMSESGVQKPLYVNEMSLFCYEDPKNPPEDPTCMVGLTDEQLEPYYEAQADFLVRSMVRGLSENLMGFTWYTLNGPGWRNGGLLNSDQNPRPVYMAYKQLIQQLDKARYIAPTVYENNNQIEIETYAFRRGSQQVHVLWTGTTDSSTEVAVPSGFVEAYTSDGTSLSPSNGLLPVGFSPIYIILSP